jgi:hypothetical protein
MKITNWIEGASELDNVAYSIYYEFEMDRQKNFKNDLAIVNPGTFVYFKEIEFKYFYDEAKIQLRRLKIERLKK